MLNLRCRQRHAGALALVLFCLTIFILGASQKTHAQSGQGNEWTRPLPISGALPGSWFPSVAAQDDGTVNVIWTVTQDNQPTIYFSRYDRVAWSRPVDILIGGLHADLRLDGRNLLHLVYFSGSNIYATDAAIDQAGAAQGWNQPLKLNRQAGQTGEFLVAPDSTLHAVWTEADDLQKDNQLAVYGRSDDGGQSWAHYRVIGEGILPTTRVRLNRAPSGTLYALWSIDAEERKQEGIALTWSKNNGETWMETPRTLAFADAPIRQPVLAIDSKGTLILIYNFGVKDEIFYQVSTDEGATWSEQKPIPGLFAASPPTLNDYFAIANDSANRVHLIASGRASKDQTEPGIYHVSWDDAKWSAARELYRGNTFVEYPDISVSNGNRLHVVFSTRARGRASSEPDASYQVWYTTSETDAPAATRMPLPTFTPVPAPTSTRTLVPDPTRRPTSTPAPPSEPINPDAAPTTNTQLPVLVGVIPVLVILGVVLALNTILRRRR